MASAGITVGPSGYLYLALPRRPPVHNCSIVAVDPYSGSIVECLQPDNQTQAYLENLHLLLYSNETSSFYSLVPSNLTDPSAPSDERDVRSSLHPFGALNSFGVFV